MELLNSSVKCFPIFGFDNRKTMDIMFTKEAPNRKIRRQRSSQQTLIPRFLSSFNHLNSSNNQIIRNNNYNNQINTLRKKINEQSIWEWDSKLKDLNGGACL
jgi:hypothetical protein